MKSKILSIVAAGMLALMLCACSAPASAVSTQADMSHSIGLAGVSNARDVGGYKTTGGKTVKTGMLLRTGALGKATDADKKILTDTYHVSQIIDFRSDEEIQTLPDPQLADAISTHVQVMKSVSVAASPASSPAPQATPAGTPDALDSTIAMVKAMGDVNAYMAKVYPGMVTDDYSVGAYKQFFEIVCADHSGAILYHCTAGKDRAGVASILLLSALGVDRATVTADYMLTNEFVKASSDAAAAAAAKKGADETVQQSLRLLNGVDKPWADAIFNTIDSTYGSMDNFLKTKLGLTDEKLAKLQKMYLQ